MEIFIGGLLIAGAVLWAIVKEAVRGKTSTPTHNMSHASSLIALLLGMGLIIYGCAT